MIAAWMAYSTAVGVLLGVGAAALERVARAYGWPGRWAWAGAVVGAAAAPVVAWLGGGEGGGGGPGGAVALGPVEVIVPGVGPEVMATARPVLEALNGPLAASWIVASAAFALYGVVAAVQLRRRRRGWLLDAVEGERVLVSRDTGPAVAGWLRGTVVLPEWALALEPGWRRLVVAHEREHVRAGDPALLALGLFARALFPWNAALWWQVRRLRLAVEMDCDERVLRAHPDVRQYGALLIEVGRRASLSGALLATLSEPRSFLERRIRRMVSGRGRRRAAQVLGLVVVCAGAVVLACETPVPERATGARTTFEEQSVEGLSLPPEVEAPPESPSEFRSPLPPAASREELPRAPVPTPFTVAPELKNRAEVQRALERYYPPLLRDAGIGGTVLVWFFIDETGKVRNSLIKESSGHKALDEAALKVAEIMQFTPALNRDEEVPVWIALPIEFRTVLR